MGVIYIYRPLINDLYYRPLINVETGLYIIIMSLRLSMLEWWYVVGRLSRAVRVQRVGDYRRGL